MNREFIPHEEALALNELGYEGDIIGMYDEDKYLFTLHEQDDIEDEWLPAPLYQQAFRWFREKYSWNGWVDQGFTESFRYNICESNGSIIGVEGFSTYEDAELACLKKLIEIAKQK